MGHNRHHLNLLTFLSILGTGMMGHFLFSPPAFAAAPLNCNLALASAGQIPSANYLACIKQRIDNQYVSCSELPYNGYQSFDSEVQPGNIVRADHIKILQQAIRNLATIQPESLPEGASISFTHDFTAANYVGSPLSATDLSDLITNINKFECPLCAPQSLPVNDTTAYFPNVTGEGYIATVTCAGGNTASATCGANGVWSSATGTCCAAGETWDSVSSCCILSTCPLNGSCGAGSNRCGGTCACQGGQNCLNNSLCCDTGQILYNGACCSSNMVICSTSSCADGTGNCGTACTCGSGLTCSSGQCISVCSECQRWNGTTCVTSLPCGNSNCGTDSCGISCGKCTGGSKCNSTNTPGTCQTVAGHVGIK